MNNHSFDIELSKFNEYISSHIVLIENTKSQNKKYLYCKKIFEYLLTCEYDWAEKEPRFKKVVIKKLRDFIKISNLDDEQVEYFNSVYRRILGINNFCVSKSLSGNLCRNRKKSNNRCFIHNAIYEKRMSIIEPIIGIEDLSKIIVDYI